MCGPSPYSPTLMPPPSFFPPCPKHATTTTKRTHTHLLLVINKVAVCRRRHARPIAHDVAWVGSPHVLTAGGEAGGGTVGGGRREDKREGGGREGRLEAGGERTRGREGGASCPPHQKVGGGRREEKREGASSCPLHQRRLSPGCRLRYDLHRRVHRLLHHEGRQVLRLRGPLPSSPTRPPGV